MYKSVDSLSKPLLTRIDNYERILFRATRSAEFFSKSFY
jgi:hypothetical protein